MDILIENGPYAMVIAPALGGAVRELTWNGAPVLRRAAPGAGDVLDMAMFPLTPIANRIARGRFQFNGRAVQLRPNFGDHPHWLHGHGWQSAWRVMDKSADAATLAFEHAADEWPWPYACEQRFSVSEGGASVALTVRNLSDAPMPMSFGFHPYFPNRREMVATARVTGMWAIDETVLPTHETAPIIDLPGGAKLADAPFVDHCFTGWDGVATLASKERVVTMEASREFGFLHAYVPPDQDFFCIEPVSAMPDVVNRQDVPGTGLITLASGESRSGWVKFSVRAL